MSATLLDGKALAAEIRKHLQSVIANRSAEQATPSLAVVLVGDDPASHVYVRSKEKAAAEVGVNAIDFRRPAKETTDSLLGLIAELNGDTRVHGILVQLPLPAHVDATRVLDAIDPRKDVDGFHPENIGRLAQGRPRFVAATPKGCMTLLRKSGVDISGKRAVVVGRSNIVGKPMSMLLTQANATVTLCHSRTQDLPLEISKADIVIAAIGREHFVKGAWLKSGSVVIDVGINRNSQGKLCGDVEFESACQKVAAITPVPGGVGPMTIASLLENTLDAANLV